ncbi:ZU5 domain-containing protein [Desulfobotulus alkaliphilus]|uniref:ZU5 domain-containing protein n=1 Tax=Desulfobotulus alkaliphilus TaxID=622671 RepID=A0A562RMR8_9BACT|nr:hypothetical protein [Desulfobotulus alkaliphilus]TWI70299.1 ZU5 domain-containing protein [Desulfobotulus alkaliphilus]
MHILRISTLCLCLFFVMGCTEEKTDTPPAQPPAKTRPEASMTFDFRGGDLKVTDRSSSIFDAGITLAAHALASPETIEIRPASLPAPLPAGEKAAGPAVAFAPHGLLFQNPAILTLPYAAKTADGSSIHDYRVHARYFDPIAGQWKAMPLKKRDIKNKTVSFESNHFSVYIASVQAPDTDFPAYPQKLTPGEYFVHPPEFRLENGKHILIEKGRINRPGMQAGTPFHLYVRFYDQALLALVDQQASVNTKAGHRAAFTEDGTGVILDTFPVFEKVRASGDARLWRWESVFVAELTRLVNYKTVDEQNPYVQPFPVNERLYAEIEAVNEREIRLSWGFDLPMEMESEIYQDNPRAQTLCIAFEATFLGFPNGEEP